MFSFAILKLKRYYVKLSCEPALIIMCFKKLDFGRK